MVGNQLEEAEVNRLGGTVQLGTNLREALVLVAAETDHLTLLGHRPAVVVLGVHDTGSGDGTLRNSGRGTSVHFVVRRCSPACNRIRFECMKLECRKKGLNLRPTAYKAGALPLSYDGRKKERNEMERELLLGIEPRLRASKAHVLTTGR